MALPIMQSVKSRAGAAKAKAKSSTMKRVMKAKRVSKVAKGKLARALVLRGSKEKTTGGLRREDVMKNQRGKIVSRRASVAAKKRCAGSRWEAWIKACSTARKALGITGFCPINGKTVLGKALYVKAKVIYTAA